MPFMLGMAMTMMVIGFEWSSPGVDGVWGEEVEVVVAAAIEEEEEVVVVEEAAAAAEEEEVVVLEVVLQGVDTDPHPDVLSTE